MCLNPIQILNPNLGRAKSGLCREFFLDTTSVFINVPCGHCYQCIALRQGALVQRILMESLNNHLFMLTLTYDNEHLPSYVTSSGYELTYADPRDFVLMLKRLHRWNFFEGYNIRYLGVTERGTKRHRPHFHFILLVPKQVAPTFDDVMNLEKYLYNVFRYNWCTRDGTSRKPIYTPNFQYHEAWIHGELKRNYDFHYINPSFGNSGTSDACWYVLKYMLKENDYEQRLKGKIYLNYEREEADNIWKTVKSKTFYSSYFGLNGHLSPFADVECDPDIVSYLDDCIHRSIGVSPYPIFFNPDTGEGQPMCQYYLKHRGLASIYNLDIMKKFWDFANGDNPTDLQLSNVKITEDDPSLARYRVNIEKSIKRAESISSSVDDYLDLFD